MFDFTTVAYSKPIFSISHVLCDIQLLEIICRNKLKTILVNSIITVQNLLLVNMASEKPHLGVAVIVYFTLVTCAQFSVS
jgi:hypothetical protein